MEEPRSGTVSLSPGLTLGLLALALSSCQSYESLPLRPEEHRAAWHGRTLEGATADSIREFAARLRGAADEQPDAFDPADGLTLREAQLVALVFHPDLRLARLRAGVEAVDAAHAGLWEDPEFSLSVLRITESVPDRWVVTPALTFTIPLSGRRDAERGRADAAWRVEERRVLEAEWAVRHEVRAAWHDWSAGLLRLEETQRWVDALDGLVATARQLADAGELARPEAALFAIEQAQQRSRVRALEGRSAEAEQALRAALGLAPEAPVRFVTSLAAGPSGALEPFAAAALAERNPTLARLAAEYALAEQTLRRAIARQTPDLTLGPQLERDEGLSKVGFLGGLPLPLWSGNRRAVAAARAEREVARAAFEVAYERLAGRGAALAARVTSLATQREDMDRVLAPLVDEQLRSALELLRLGEGTGLVLLESLARAQQTKLERIDVALAESLARAELEFLNGPAVPVTREEDR